MSRPSLRKNDELREIIIETGFSKHAEGSCKIHFGDTIVLCTASVEAGVPRFMRNSGEGWITAEYGMLPRSTNTRMNREAARGKQSGRTQEIQRLIGRSLRAAIDMKLLGERTIKIDCDVIQADGGTRTASITGAFVAMKMAIDKLIKDGYITRDPFRCQIAAISCGIYRGIPVLDLDYDEDSTAEADANFVLTSTGNIVEIQGTAEDKPFSEEQFNALFSLAKAGISELCKKQLDSL